MYTHVNLFIWIFSLYNRTPLYGRLLNTDTSLLRAVFLVPRGSKPSNFPLSVRIDGVWLTQIFWTLYQAAKCPAHNAYVSIWHWISMSHALLSPLSRSGSRIFSRRGCTRLMLYFNTNKPHSFFFCKIPVVLENHRSSRAGGGRVRTPCTLPLDPPLPEYIRELVSLKAQGACNLRTTSGILLAMTDLFKSQLQRSEMLCRGSAAQRQTLILSSAISKPIFLRLLMTNVTISKF